MSFSNWERFSEVFCSLQNGNFINEIDSFSDDQLRPFLPFLVSTAFGPGIDTNSVPERLLARVVSFQRDDEILNLVNVDFESVEAKSNDCKDIHSVAANTFSTAESTDKYRILLGKLSSTDHGDSSCYPFVSDDLLESASTVLSLALIHMPDCVEITQFTHKMLSLFGGPHILTTVVCNIPSLLHPVLTYLISLPLGENDGRGKNRAHMIANLLTLCPPMLGWALSELSRNKKDVPLTVRLCAQRSTNEQLIRFVTSQLVEKSTPFSSVLCKSSARSAHVLLNDRLMKIILELSKSDSKKPYGELISCITSLQLLLQMNSNYKANSADMKNLIVFLCNRKVDNDTHIVLALCSVIALQALTQSPSGMAAGSNIDPQIIEFLHWLKQRASNASDEKAFGAAERALTLTAMCLWASKNDELNKFLSEILATRVMLKDVHFKSLRAIFNKVFPESELAYMCTRQPITRNLHEGCGGGYLLPVNWVLELLRHNVFNRHNINIGPWIESQICQSVLPIHGAIAEVIEKYAGTSAEKGQGLTVQFVEDTFAGPLLDEKLLPRKILVVTYLLGFRYKFIRSGRKEENHYESFYLTLPIRYLLSVVETRCSEFEKVRTFLVRNTVTMYPHMMPTTDSILLAKQEARLSVSLSPDEASTILCGKDLSKALKLVRAIDFSPVTDLVRLLPAIISASKACLPSGRGNDTSALVSSQPLVEGVCRLWLKLEAIVPRLLVEKTILSWMVIPTHLKKLYEQPGLLFRADPRIFASPSHFECFLRILAFFLESIKIDSALAVQASNIRQDVIGPKADERDHLAAVHDHAQRTLTVQILIEICDEKRNEYVELGPRLETIRSLAFDYIHSLFIKDQHLMRIVLFEAFPLHMVRVVVEGVPSLHVATVFVKEMLQLPDLRRRIFAVALTVELCRKYRVISSFPIMQMMLDCVCTLVRYGKTDQHLKLMERTIPVLGEAARVFPQLAEPVCGVMRQVSSIAHSRLAMNALSLVSKNVMEKRLINAIDSEIENIASQTALRYNQ